VSRKSAFGPMTKQLGRLTSLSVPSVDWRASSDSPLGVDALDPANGLGSATGEDGAAARPQKQA
jgi:hypothetical protein